MTTRHVLQLYLAEGVGPVTLGRALRRPDAARVATDELTDREFGRLAGALGLPPRAAQSAVEVGAESRVLAEELRRHGCEVLSLIDPRYPASLRARLGESAPPILFARGDLRLLEEPGVGFCGSREASAAGLEAADAIARELARAGVTIVSGNARGVDAAAHRAALETSGRTVFVTPEGILRFRPRPEIRDVAGEARWLALSEVPPRLGWLARNAMRRNRVLCGLSRAVVLVEAGMSGGTFEAGKTALELGVPLFAVEYAAPAASASGNAYFLARGAEALRRFASGAPRVRPVLQALAVPATPVPAQGALQLA